MTKLQSRTASAFLIGMLLVIIGIVCVSCEVDILWVKLIMTPGTILICVSSIMMSLNPLRQE
jgi:hypothetical protein